MAISLRLLTPRLCTLKCFPMSVMFFLSSYTLTVTSPHPSTQKGCTYPMHLGFVVPLNTMTNSCCFNTGFVGNEKTWPCWLPGKPSTASPKPLFSTCQQKVMNKPPRAELQHRQERTLYFSISVKLSPAVEPRKRHFGGRIIILHHP